MQVQEYNIKVPWGHIAVKAWGNKNDTPVLVTHGIQDNAGIFDRIMPLLPHCFYYMCIDFPSHGRSTYFPTQMFISPMDGVTVIKLLLDYLQRNRYILLGHSWGAHAAFMFTQLYPDYVIKLCLIDGLHPFPLSPKMYKAYWTQRIEGLIKINNNINNKAPPSYTYEEAMDKLLTNRLFGGITEPTAHCLLKRCLSPTENGKYMFTTDPHLRVFLLSGHDVNYMTGIAKKYPVQCPMLIIQGSESQEQFWSSLDPLLKVVKDYPKCKIEELQGNHDDFSNKPEPWAALISQFLCSEYCRM